MELAQIKGWEAGLVVLIFVVSIFLGILVFLKNRKDKSNIYFLGFSLSCAFLILFAYLSEFFPRTIPQLSLVLGGKLVFSFATLLLIFFFYFSYVFPVNKRLPYYFFWPFLISGLILVVLCLFTPFIVKDIKLQPWGFNLVYGSLYNVIFLPLSILLTIASLINLILNYRVSDKLQKTQLKFIFLGLGVFLCSGVFFGAILPLITESQEFYRVGNYSAIFFIGFTAYAITKHKLFNIRVIITEIAVAILSAVLFIEVFISRSIAEGVIKAVVLIVATYGGYLLIRSVIKEIEQRKEMERLAKRLEVANSNLLALQRINNKIVSTLDIKKVTQEIVDSIPRELKYVGGFLVLVDERHHRIKAHAISGGKILKRISRFLKKPFTDYSAPLGGEESAIQKAIRKVELEFSADLSEVVKGAISTKKAKAVQKILRIKTFAVSPIVSRGKVIGAIIFALRKEKEKIKDEERKMMSSIADQAAIAIENAQLYEQVEKINERLKELDKLKNEFLSIASHQVRTPLSIIKGYIHTLSDNKKIGKLTKQQERFMRNIQEANDQLINIMNDFLNLSRIEQGRMKLDITKGDIDSIVKEVVERLKIEAERKKIKLLYAEPKKKIDKINIDESKITEVITNLVDNAIKYTPEKGTVKLSVKKIGKNIRIRIKDTGIGIPKEFRDRLFQKFARASNAIQVQPSGNGIGLFLVQQIINAHQGYIELSSEVGKGTIFNLYLSYESGLKKGKEIDATKLSKKGIIRYREHKYNYS